MTILCIAVALVGRPFMLKAKEMGHRVIVMTNAKRLDEAWPRDKVDEVFAVPDVFDEKVVRNVVSYLARHQKIDRVVPMGDFDVEVAAMLREHLRLPGMGETTMRYFRDKLAMRMKTQEDGIAVPEFVHILNYDAINAYMDRVPAPWVLKPRQEAASYGIKKVNHRDELWPLLDKLGDKQSEYLLEKYTPGDVFHVDAVVSERKVMFASVSKYGTPMLDLNTTGGMFTTRTIERGSADEKALQKLNQEVIQSLGLVRGVTHIEYIKSKEDGKFYFLEAGARVGAARIPDVVWHATDLCLWHEWVQIEVDQDKKPYKLPKIRDEYAGTIITLARQETPDLSGYTDPEICYRQARKHHAGLVVKSKDPKRVEELLNQYAERFVKDFVAHVPMKAQ
ncbi:ATP-grasp domain-containing protein [bacterium]|nr:ATP-grasp domain-containing protein [bacterium]